MKSIRSLAVLFFVVALVFPVVSSAEEKKLNPWTDCGIGAMIFKKTPVAAVISNVIWDLGTTAVTSAGVSEHTCEGEDAQAALFVNKTYANLAEETAKGDGQHVTAMLNILGCEESSHADIISSVRTDFAQSVQNPAYLGKSSTSKAEDYYNIVQASVSGKFAKQCQTKTL